MIWPFRRKADPSPPEKKNYGAVLSAARMTAPPAYSYDRMASEGYGQNPVVRRCVDMISTSVASIELVLFRRNGDDLEKVERFEEPDASPAMQLLTLMDRPNPLQSGKEFLRHLTSYYCLSGNAFVLGNFGLNGRQKTPLGLDLLLPKCVQVVAPERGVMPRAYRYRTGANDSIEYPVDQVTGRSPVLHLKTFNPLSHWYGLAPLEAAALAVDQHNAGSQWNYSLLKNGAKPDGALVVKNQDGGQGSLTDEQYSRLKAMIDQQFSGSSNAGRPLLLEGGLEWQEMAMNPKDADFLNGKHAAAADIAMAFGVPPQLIGIPGSLTYANMEQANQAFWNGTVLTTLGDELEALNRWLVPLYGEDLFLWYDPDTIDALEPLRAAKSDRLNRATFLTPNEKREGAGYDKLDSEMADTLLVPSSSVPLDLVGAMNLNEPGSPADPSPQPEPAPAPEPSPEPEE